MTLDIEIQLYLQSAPFASEDAFQIATADFLEKLEQMDLLAWFFTGNNIFRRALAPKKGEKVNAHYRKAKLAAILAGKKAKRMGAKAGIHDCFIYSHNVTIELKQPEGNLSTEQRAFKRKAERWGWRCYRARAPEEVVEALVGEGIIPGRKR